MISYIFKLIIFSIILGTLTLIYKNNCAPLYKNINYKYNVLLPSSHRSLAELSYEPTTKYKHENNELREYGYIKETKYKNNEYPNDKAKVKEKVPEVIEKENSGIKYLKKYRKETYDKEKEEQSNISSRSLKYLEMQRKFYNNFYVKPEIYFEKISDKSCERLNKMKTYHKLPSSNKVHDNYLDNLKEYCTGAVSTCSLSSLFTGIFGVGAGAAGDTAVAIKTFDAFKTALQLAFSSDIFYPCGIVALVLIIIVVVLVILYMWLYRRRTNSWKHECKKHSCT